MNQRAITYSGRGNCGDNRRSRLEPLQDGHRHKSRCGACRLVRCAAITDFRHKTTKHISCKVASPFAGKTDKLQSCMGIDRRRRSVHRGMVIHRSRITSSYPCILQILSEPGRHGPCSVTLFRSGVPRKARAAPRVAGTAESYHEMERRKPSR